MDVVFSFNGRFWLYKQGFPATEISQKEGIKLIQDKVAEYRKGFFPPENVETAPIDL